MHGEGEGFAAVVPTLGAALALAVCEGDGASIGTTTACGGSERRASSGICPTEVRS